MNRTAKIDVTKIDKTQLFQGKTAKYLDLIFFENREGPDQYGNDGYIVQGVSKEARDRGERGAIIGNWKRMKPKQAKPQPAPAKAAPDKLNPAPEPPEDDVPF